MTLENNVLFHLHCRDSLRLSGGGGGSKRQRSLSRGGGGGVGFRHRPGEDLMLDQDHPDKARDRTTVMLKDRDMF